MNDPKARVAWVLRDNSLVDGYFWPDPEGDYVSVDGVRGRFVSSDHVVYTQGISIPAPFMQPNMQQPLDEWKENGLP